MRAALLTSFNSPYCLATVPTPIVKDENDVLLRVTAASYCHTDAVLASGAMQPNPPTLPHIGCHEFAGIVVSMSSGAARYGFKAGDLVGVPGRAFRPCGKCLECKTGVSGAAADGLGDEAGYSVYCPKAGNLGVSAAGGFAEYAVVDARQIARAPESMVAEQIAPLMCAGLTVYAALRKCGLVVGQSVGILGAGGGLGHLGCQFATEMGLRVVAVENGDAPLKLLKELDLDTETVEIIDSRVVSAKDARCKLYESGKTLSPGLDAVLVLPESQKAFEYGVELLRDHGKCCVVSFPAAGFHVSAKDLVFRDIQVFGSLVGSNKMLREMLVFAAEHRVKAMVRTFPLDGINELVEEYHRGCGGKLVVQMDDK